MDERTPKDVIELYRKNDGMIRVKIIYSKDILNVISAYAPQVRIEKSIKREFGRISTM